MLIEKDIIVCAISELYFLTLREKIILLKKLDSVNSIALLSIKVLSAIIGRTPKRAVINGNELLQNAKVSAAVLKARNISYCLYGDKNYPPMLKEIPDAPFALFYRGNIACLLQNCVSVVGTRRLTVDGAEAAFRFSYEAAKNGETVISGLAFGADGKAHCGAIQAGLDILENPIGISHEWGKTCAVLPCGIDSVVPYGNRKIAEKILQTGGCLVSEYSPGIGAEPWRFVQRNRIVAGLAPAVVVVQAPPGSGALITADFALDYNREVIFHKSSISPEALKVSQVSVKLLERKISCGEKKKNKLDRILSSYLEAGAPVIESYEEYKACLKDLPGKHSIQLSFDLESI